MVFYYTTWYLYSVKVYSIIYSNALNTIIGSTQYCKAIVFFSIMLMFFKLVYRIHIIHYVIFTTICMHITLFIFSRKCSYLKANVLHSYSRWWCWPVICRALCVCTFHPYHYSCCCCSYINKFTVSIPTMNTVIQWSTQLLTALANLQWTTQLLTALANLKQ